MITPAIEVKGNFRWCAVCGKDLPEYEERGPRYSVTDEGLEVHRHADPLVCIAFTLVDLVQAQA